MRISSVALQQIVAHAAQFPDRETCGLLFGRADDIDTAEPCTNVAERPDTAFEIDPARLIAAHRAQRMGGPRLVGCYHSHPGGAPVPSPRDAAAAAPDGMLWLIVADGAARLWRAAPDGAVEGRFDPVPLDIAPATCASGGASPEGAGE